MAHELLHTSSRSRKRIADAHIPLVRGTGERKTTVQVCVGTSCFLRGSQNLLTTLIHRIAEEAIYGADVSRPVVSICGHRLVLNLEKSI